MSKYQKMVACNRKSSADKIELAKKTIFKMLDEGEKITIPKLIAKKDCREDFFTRTPLYEAHWTRHLNSRSE